MSRSQTSEILRSTTFAVIVAIGFTITSLTGAGASPEDEIARLNRVRANLFEELVKTRAEAASARVEQEAAIKGREAAEAELARLKEAASAKLANPVQSTETKVEPQQRTTTATPRALRGQSVRPEAPRVTGAVQRTATASAHQRAVRSSHARRAVARRTDQAPRELAAPVAQAQELPSVLRLQDPR